MVFIRNAININKIKDRSSMMKITTVAYCGFIEFGEEIEWYDDVTAIHPNREDIVVGSISDIVYIFKSFGIKLPVIDYPEELERFYGRKMWTEPSLHNLVKKERTGIFIKPAEGMKKFTAKVISKPTDYCDLIFEEDLPVKCSEVVDIVSEWRCYIRYGELLAVKHYSGDMFTPPDRDFVYDAIKAYTTAPAGYSLDVGVLRNGRNIAVEINDGYSLGTYGVWSVPYAKLLSARYSQLMGVRDPYL